MKKIKHNLNNFFNYILLDQRAIGVIELVLILVVLIALVLIFKDRITNLLNTIFSTIDTEASKVWSSI